MPGKGGFHKRGGVSGSISRPIGLGRTSGSSRYSGAVQWRLTRGSHVPFSRRGSSTHTEQGRMWRNVTAQVRRFEPKGRGYNR